MAYRKTGYKKFKDGGAVLPSTPVDVEFNTPKADIAADHATEHLLNAVEAPHHTTSIDVPSDTASSAFQKQIDDLRQAEHIQRQRQAAPAMPETREGRLVYWRNHGMGDDEVSYLNSLVENPGITRQAVMAARQGGLADETSQDFHDKVRANFQLLNGVHPADVTLDGESSPKADEFAEPAPAPKSKPRPAPEPQNRGSMYSAPVSRETTANGSYDSHGDRPGTVRLSVAQKEAARYSGISERDYAEQVLKLRAEKSQGRYGGDP